jgi:hypothetical protein
MNNMLLEQEQEQEPRQDELHVITTPSALRHWCGHFQFRHSYCHLSSFFVPTLITENLVLTFISVLHVNNINKSYTKTSRIRTNDKLQVKGKAKVKQSRYRPGAAQRVPGS